MRIPTRPSRLLQVLAVSLGVSLVHPLSAVAGTITFHDLTDVVTVTFGGDAIGRATAGSDCGTGEVCTVRLLPPLPSSGNTSYGSNTIFEPGSSDISDTITIEPKFLPNFEVEYFTVTFRSDVDGGPPLVNVGNPIIEDGTLQRATSSDIAWQLGPNGAAVTDMIFFQSDIESAPEPATLALLGLGLAGLVSARRKQ